MLVMAQQETGLVDHRGRPIKKRVLTREIAAPTVAGVRQLWDGSVASGLTPVRLARLLRDSARGDSYAWLGLAEEMEERDLHYAAELGKRKLAVTRLPIKVEQASDNARDVRLAEEIRLLVRKPGFRLMLKDAMDGLGKGFSVIELLWERGQKWLPRYIWRDPRFFQFNLPDFCEVRLRDESDGVRGIPLAPYKFIVHTPKIKSGVPMRGGLARLAAWAYMCKAFSIKDWMAFAEVFGMPYRIGKYRPGTNDDDIAILKQAVAGIGSDAAAVIPDSMVIDFLETGGRQGSAEFFLTLARYLDDQVSTGILGQTASSSGTPGKLGNEELQAEVRDDIRDDDAEQLSDTLNRDLVRPYIDLNFGLQEEYPRIVIAEPDRDDVQTLVTAVKELVPLGLRVEQRVVLEKIGLPVPSPEAREEDFLRPPAKIPAPAENRARALNRSEPETDAPAAIAARLEEEADAATSSMVERCRTLLAEVDSLAGYRQRLLEIYDELEPAELGELLAYAMSLAELAGRDEVKNES